MAVAISCNDSLTLREVVYLMAQWGSYDDLASWINHLSGLQLELLQFSSLQWSTQCLFSALRVHVKGASTQVLLTALMKRFICWRQEEINRRLIIGRSFRSWLKACNLWVSMREHALEWWDVPVE
jgi:hypothetical protein